MSAPHIDPHRYTSPEFQALERERLWRRTWLLAAHVSEVPTPGSFATIEFGVDAYLVSRGPDRVRCFHNACLHRGTTLCVERRGSAAVHRCPYHGWSYDTAGRLLGGEGASLLAEPGETLVEVTCEERAGFIWIRYAKDGPTLDEHLGPALPWLKRFDPEALRLRTDRSFNLACNWKLSSDIHNEALHLTTVHPQLTEFVDVPNVRWEALGPHSRLTIPLGIPSTGPFAGRIGPNLKSLLSQLGVNTDALGQSPRPEAVRDAIRVAMRARAASEGLELSDLDPADKHQLYIFPDVQINLTGTELDLYRHRPHPTDPLRCTFDDQQYHRARRDAPAARVSHERREPDTANPRGALDQDLAMAARVQRGMLTGGFQSVRTGPLEEAIAHMHAGLTALMEGVS